jgi:S-layer homology domain
MGGLFPCGDNAPMNMLRRIGFAVFVLALAMPIGAAPATAHVTTGYAIEWGFRAGGGGTVIAGLVTNHTNSAQQSIQVTATWRNGGTVVATEIGTAFIDVLAQHSASPFKIVETQNVAGATLTVTASGTAVPYNWNGVLGIEPGSLTDDVYTGTVRNDADDIAAQNVRVFGVRRQGGIIVDAAGSAPIANLAAGEEAAFTITFDDFTGEAVGSLVAQGVGGTWRHTSWNNWFRDLGTSNFAEEIAWLADADITRGCAPQQFCPKSPVTREQMAVFLNRALDLPTAAEPAPFTDLAARPEYVRVAVANVYAAGITSGCTATTFCPQAAVTRGQMSKFIILGYELEPIPSPDLFTDDTGHFSEPYNNRMATDDITTGCGEDTYCPHATVLREQMAKFLFEAEN